ncbi:MAG: hypothetical protein V4618_08040 [Pseudomonadota bacterium]
MGHAGIWILSAALFLSGGPAYADRANTALPEDCELHIWPTDKYGGIFFHAANGSFNGSGHQFDLVQTPVQQVAQKAYAVFNSGQQGKILADAVEASGKFEHYRIVLHDPLPADRAKKYGDLLTEPIGAGGPEITPPTRCYAEIHVAFVTAFRTTLTKMLMTGFLVRYFSSATADSASRVIHSRPMRGEERIGLSNFDFSSPAIAPGEGAAIAGAFKFMADRFLRKKVVP